MMNQQLKSHWRLAYRTFVKAIKVTINTTLNSLRAHLYIQKSYRYLERQRELFAMLDPEVKQ